LKVYLDSVGCRLNQSEIEGYARQFRAAGHDLVGNLDEAELLVLNTCAVTAAAASDSRQKVRRARRAGVNDIVVTGCWSEMEAERARNMPGVSRVVPNREKDDLVGQLLQIDFDEFELEPLARRPIPGERNKTRAFIKVQDGCDNRCTFCVTTIARGAGRSRSVEQVLADVQAALAGGAKEVVLTGVHLGSWGYDFDEPRHLRQLVEAVLGIEELPRLRLSSLEPWDLHDDFFRLWEDERLCRHLHLPLQSGSAATLRRMARNTTPKKFKALVEGARAAIPDLAVTTDVIVGFPGESEAEFEESLRFVEAVRFADAHVFTYSERSGTVAAGMPHPVQNGVRKERNTRMRAAVAESGAAFRRQFLGQKMDVLWEAETPLDEESWQVVGLTDNYLRVEAASSGSLWNQIRPARLTAVTAGGMRGAMLGQRQTVWFEQ
jgi:threonylcarbamoyladenosine tRNA methylthiotransferase MtaB